MFLREELIVGKTYLSEKYSWTLKVLYIGKTRVFAQRMSDGMESSWEISMILENFIEIEEIL